MVIGIGSITAGCSLNLVCLSSEIAATLQLRRYLVIYRSKDSKLPDFSREDSVVGDVFFDVPILDNLFGSLSNVQKAKSAC